MKVLAQHLLEIKTLLSATHQRLFQKKRVTPTEKGGQRAMGQQKGRAVDRAVDRAVKGTCGLEVNRQRIQVELFLQVHPSL